LAADFLAGAAATLLTGFLAGAAFAAVLGAALAAGLVLAAAWTDFFGF
jgi:hypothetical protein